MKLKLYSVKSLFFLTSLLIGGFSASAQSPSFSFQTTSNCYSSINNSVSAVITGTVAGATSYSWTVNSATCNPSSSVTAPNGTMLTLSFPCASTHTIACQAYAGSSLIGTPTSQTFQMIPSPTITTASAPSNTVCAGSSLTVTASGAGTYTWVPANLTGSTVVLAPTANTCYTITATALNGCPGATVMCVTALPTPTLSISSSGTNICAGSSATLSASGAVTYSWSTATTVSSIVVTPTTSTCYTVAGSNAFGCTSSTAICIIVSPTPTITASSSSSSLCLGATAILTAGGTGTYTWYPPGLASPTIIVSPSVSTCYTLVGSNASMCTSTALICLSLWPNPTVAITGSAPNNTVCLGSSITLSASSSNAIVYSWSNPTGSTSVINFIPANTSPSVSTVSVIDANGCSGSASVAVYGNAGCADVWPGDANRDGQVTSTDVFELGLAASSTGPARTATSIAWSAHQASSWSGTVSTGWNLAHADCNGDGVVNSNDNAAITANFSLTHAFKPSAASVGNDIKLIPQQAFANAGQWNVADIVLGDATNSISQLYGVAFDLGYDQSMVQPDSVKIAYTTSFLNNNNTNIDFEKTIYASGKLYAATVRTDHANVNGNGKIGELWYKVKGGLASGSSINLSVSNVIKISGAGLTSTLTPAAPVSLAINSNPTGIESPDAGNILLSCFPNPANDAFFLISGTGLPVQYSLKDVMGREVLQGQFTSTLKIDTETFAPGVYFIDGTLNGKHTTLKVVISK